MSLVIFSISDIHYIGIRHHVPNQKLFMLINNFCLYFYCLTSYQFNSL